MAVKCLSTFCRMHFMSSTNLKKNNKVIFETKTYSTAATHEQKNKYIHSYLKKYKYCNYIQIFNNFNIF